MNEAVCAGAASINARKHGKMFVRQITRALLRPSMKLLPAGQSPVESRRKSRLALLRGSSPLIVARWNARAAADSVRGLSISTKNAAQSLIELVPTSIGGGVCVHANINQINLKEKWRKAANLVPLARMRLRPQLCAPPNAPRPDSEKPVSDGGGLT